MQTSSIYVLKLCSWMQSSHNALENEKEEKSSSNKGISYKWINIRNKFTPSID